MADLSDIELARVFADAAKLLAGQDSLGGTAEDIVAVAVSVVPGAEAAGLSLARNGRIETPAATDGLAAACDGAQHEAGEGPCLQAVWEDRVLRVDDMSAETRWPEFAKRALDIGVNSMLACHLSSERGSMSALNLYARAPHAFDEQAVGISRIYATHATIALEFSRIEGDLRAAVETRQGIGQAVGIVMERHRLSAKQAFDLLVRSSQKLNVKLRALADVVVSTGIDPAAPEELARIGIRVTGVRPVQSPRRSAEDQLAAAEEHDRAALEHERKAEEHRLAAEAARAAARADLDKLN